MDEVDGLCVQSGRARSLFVFVVVEAVITDALLKHCQRRQSCLESDDIAEGRWLRFLNRAQVIQVFVSGYKGLLVVQHRLRGSSYTVVRYSVIRACIYADHVPSAIVILDEFCQNLLLILLISMQKIVSSYVSKDLPERSHIVWHFSCLPSQTTGSQQKRIMHSRFAELTLASADQC